MKEEKSIVVSPKHGVNPSMCRCTICGKTYGVALLGKLKGDAEAPKEVFEGLCGDCQGVMDKGGVIILEVRDGETGDNPYRTGRLIGLSKEFKERNHIDHPVMYMEQSMFSKMFSGVEFKK